MEDTSQWPHLKYDLAFALLTAMSPHKIAMFYELNIFFRLDTILNGKPFGLRNCVSQQHANNIGENNNRRNNRL